MKKSMLTALATALLLAAWPAAAENWTEAEYQTAYRLLEACNTPQAMSSASATALEMQMKAHPQLVQYRSVFAAFMEKYMGYEAIKKPLAEAYLERFTPAELQEMIVFFESPTGRKLAANQAQLFQHGAEIGKKQVQAHVSELQLALMQAKQQNLSK